MIIPDKVLSDIEGASQSLLLTEEEAGQASEAAYAFCASCSAAGHRTAQLYVAAAMILAQAVRTLPNEMRGGMLAAVQIKAGQMAVALDRAFALIDMPVGPLN